LSEITRQNFNANAFCEKLRHLVKADCARITEGIKEIIATKRDKHEDEEL